MQSILKYNVIPFAALLLLVFGVSSCKKDTFDRKRIEFVQAPGIDSLKINQLQSIGSHNSYRRKTFQPIFDLFATLSQSILPEEFNTASWDYDHLPLPEQLSKYGMRCFEIDIYNDPEGGNFYNRYGNKLVGAPVPSKIPELKDPGFKVLHIPDVDYNTNYYTFKQSLKTLKEWSDAHPGHIPIAVMIETKSLAAGDVLPLPQLTRTIPYTVASADALDVEIKDIFGSNLDKIITPDDVRGSYTTLEEAVLAGNWPRLGEARGKFLFVLSGDLERYYEQGHPSLKNRSAFTFAEPGEDHAAIIIRNNPVSNYDEIKDLVGRGYIIRTMVGGTETAKSGDYSKVNAAFENGAQLIYTDYYRADPRSLVPNSGWTDFHVIFPGNVTFRINAINAPDKVDLGKIGE